MLVLSGTRAEAAGRVYNLSDWCTIDAFAGAIADALVSRVRYADDRVEGELAYQPSVSIAEGLRRLVKSREAS